MFQDGRHRCRVTGLKGRKQCFRLPPEMVEIRTGRKILFHEKFSMISPGSANRRHEERGDSLICQQVKSG